MPALAPTLRKTLETTVVKGRDLAERGARDAVTALAVGANEPFASMGEGERKLRNRLRARGRQLGDQKSTQGIERLVREMAYEHWHRMLFARFLAENKLLIEPSSGVSISLDECAELAAEEGTDLWELAATFAQAMLPQIFRLDDPVLAVKLPLEIRQQLQGLVAGLEVETFTASDSLGWTYQFWQTKRKKEVNDSGVKIGADELSPVTQLFTEDYMVDFLLDNTLGAWHAGKVLAANPQLAATAQSEEELRQAVALQGCPWNYLRFIKTDDGPWAPASGTYEGWPKTAAELKCLDPCMGSGHFVVAMFERLVALRMAEEGVSEKTALSAVIEVNLFGLEIDPRCTQIGAFNLALAAWRRVGYCPLPAMNLACSGLAPNTSESEWLALAGDNERLRNGMKRLYQLFDNAAVLGSLINPRAGEADLFMAGFNELQPLLEQALAPESQDDTSQEVAVTARGLAKAAEILADQFTLVATNVPYLGKADQVLMLQDYAATVFPEGKADLATCFVERALQFLSTGNAALVTPQNWLFLGSYKELRKRLLREQSWNAVARLGEKGFQSSQAAGAFAALSIISGIKSADSEIIAGLDASGPNDPAAKAELLREGDLLITFQPEQLANPDSIFSLSRIDRTALMRNTGGCYQGISTGDTPRATLCFWELNSVHNQWKTFQTPSETTQLYGGRSAIVNYMLLDQGFESAAIRGQEAWGKRGIAIGQMRSLPATLYEGSLFSNSTPVIVPHDPDHLAALWLYCQGPYLCADLRKLNPKISVDNGYVSKVPFDLSSWQKVAAEKYPEGLPKPFSNDPSQWLFNGHPAGAGHPLHVAVARLVGYEWPRQTGSSFPDCPALGPDGLEALADEDGIVCLSPVRGEASAVERLRKLLATALGEEWSSSKERELLLATAVDNNAKKPEPDLESWLRSSFFGEHCKLFHSRPFIWQIWDGHPHGFSALVNYHKLAAPNCQGRKTLEQLTFTYLGDWIDRQKLDQAEGVNGADDRLAAALDLQGQLKKILEGEPPFDIFVRWKPLHQQAIGWDPDINDGVRLNIRPFLKAQLRKGGRKGAGVIRWKPFEIKRKADRGNEPMRTRNDFPWFWGWEEGNSAISIDFGAPILGAPPAGDSFDGNRWNDLHYSRAAKEAARVMHRGEG